ncbi:MAG: S8 family serine peptidase [Caldilineaceae bacterium]
MTAANYSNQIVLDMVRLSPLMDRSRGREEIVIGLVDGPVADGIPALATATFLRLPRSATPGRLPSGSAAYEHGTAVAAILLAERGSAAPAICPGCTILLLPIFGGSTSATPLTFTATPEMLAEAIVSATAARVQVINLSVSLLAPTARAERTLKLALDFAAHRGTIVVAAAGNQGIVGGGALVGHPWVLPVAGSTLTGAPLGVSNLGASIGRRGLACPGENVTSIGSNGGAISIGGTSIAAAFVTGAISLLWSEYPDATAAAIKQAILHPYTRRRGIMPPLLDAWGAYKTLKQILL